MYFILYSLGVATKPVPFYVAVDIVAMTIENKELKTVVVHRETAKTGMLALPGGIVKPNESLRQAAIRELFEETGIKVEADQLHQGRAFGDPDRDPRGRYVTIAYVALLPIIDVIKAGSDAATAELVPVQRILSGKLKLEFDHNKIVRTAYKKAIKLIEETSAATSFCNRRGFSLSELRNVYETILGWEIDSANFRRKVAETKGLVEFVEAGSLTPSGGTRGRPSDTYKRGKAIELDPPMRFRGPSDKKSRY